MKEYLPQIPLIQYEGKQSNNLLAYRYYNPKQVLLNKTMEEHLRLSMSFWHTFSWSGRDIFSEVQPESAFRSQGTTNALTLAENRVKTAFEFIQKLGLSYFTFYDRDIAPEGRNLRETNYYLQVIAEKMALEMETRQIKLLWGTASLFSQKHYLEGAATHPNPQVFAYAIAQVKQALDITHFLKGENFVILGGREGYDSLLNTDLEQEHLQLARFLSLIIDYKNKIGFKGTLLIEPKPYEPTRHQYDHNTATLFAFLQRFGLENEFKINIEASATALHEHTFPHEVAYAFANNLFGSIDAAQADSNYSDAQDQLPTHLSEIAQILYLIIKHQGFTTGGINLDTKLRRHNIDLLELIYSHIFSIDALAKALLIAVNLIETKEIDHSIQKRYQHWQTPLGQSILTQQTDIEALSSFILTRETDFITQ